MRSLSTAAPRPRGVEHHRNQRRAIRCMTYTSCLMLLVVFVSACVSVGARTAEQMAPSSLVVVQNDGPEDLWIYLERNGVRTRKLGRARGLRTDTLMFTGADAAARSSIMLVAIGVTSGAVLRSNASTYQSGAAYRLQLGPAPGNAMLSVRFPRR